MQHKSITVNTNDPKHQTIVLKMKGEVVAPTKTANNKNNHTKTQQTQQQHKQKPVGAPVKKNTVH